MSDSTPSFQVIEERIYDKCDLLKEYAKMPQPDTDRMLQLINQIETLVESMKHCKL